MFKLKDIKYFINTKFRDKIIGVEPPREDWFEYHGMRTLESYIVTVNYKYAGPKDVVFGIDDEEDIDPDFSRYTPSDQQMLRDFSRKHTLRCATDFYRQTLDKINQQKATVAMVHENTK